MPTDIHLSRLIALRDEGFPQAERMKAEGRLDFSTFSACLACAWAETPAAIADGWEKRPLCGRLYPLWGEHRNSVDCLIDYFGLEEFEAMNLFGAIYGSLANRLEYLNRLIAKRGGQ